MGIIFSPLPLLQILILSIRQFELIGFWRGITGVVVSPSVTMKSIMIYNELQRQEENITLMMNIVFQCMQEDVWFTFYMHQISSQQHFGELSQVVVYEKKGQVILI